MKPNRLNRGDKVAIVSLSSGILGESFVKHELDLGIKRMEEFGLVPVFMENSLKGLDFIKNHPEKRAEDLKQAFADDEIKAIFCAIGGTDSYLTLPYLLKDESFKELVKNNFKTDEEIRFAKQQWMTWISIGVSALLGILGIIF